MNGSQEIEAVDWVAPTEAEVSETHFYFGWATYRGGWLVRKQDRSTGAIVEATVSNNGSHATLVAAWPNRTTLTYGA